MSSKRSPGWKTYKEQMAQLDHGDPLWEPAPLNYFKRIQLGDVGYVRRGCFHLLFSAGEPLGERRLGVDVPLTFQPLTVGPIVNTQPRLPGCLSTNTIRESGASLEASICAVPALEPGFSISLELSEKQGAALVTKYPTYREDIQREQIFEEYTKRNYDSWVAFARGAGHGSDVKPVLVTGVDMTRDFAMMSCSSNGVRLKSEFTVSVPGLASASASAWGTWRTEGLVHTNCGPQQCLPPSSTQPVASTSSGTSHAEPVSEEYNQCVFVRYYTIRKRTLLIPKVIKAAAGPHHLDPGNRDGDGSPLEAQNEPDSDSDDSGLSDDDWDDDEGSVTSVDSEFDTIAHNTTTDGRDDFDTVADYIFWNSNAESVLVHHRDIALLRQEGKSGGVPATLFGKRPLVVVDGNGVGRIQHTADPPPKARSNDSLDVTISVPLLVTGETELEAVGRTELPEFGYSLVTKNVVDCTQGVTAGDSDDIQEFASGSRDNTRRRWSLFNGGIFPAPGSNQRRQSPQGLASRSSRGTGKVAADRDPLVPPDSQAMVRRLKATLAATLPLCFLVCLTWNSIGWSIIKDRINFVGGDADTTACGDRSRELQVKTWNATHPNIPPPPFQLSHQQCLVGCGASGLGDIVWGTLLQEIGACLVPWIALIFQIPFSAEHVFDNVLAFFLTLGSPALAAYSLQITQLNTRWLTRALPSIEHPDLWAATVTGMSALQHVPIQLTTIPLPPTSPTVLDSAAYWKNPQRHDRQPMRWSISLVLSLVHVVIATLLIFFDTYYLPTMNNGIRYGTATIFSFLIPLTIGWLHVGSKPERNYLRELLKEANRMACGATEGGGSPVGRPRQVIEFLQKTDVGLARKDELRMNPIFNYSRVFPWSQVAEILAVNWVPRYPSGAKHCYEAERSPSTNGAPFEKRSRASSPSLSEPINWRSTLSSQLSPLTDHTGVQELSRWPAGVWTRIAIASCLALGLQWGITCAGIFIYYKMPPAGLDCRAEFLMMYGAFGTLSFFLLLASSALAHLSQRQPAQGYRYSMLRVSQEIGAILCRWLGKTLAVTGGIGILVFFLTQPLGIFELCCWCSTTTLGGPVQAAASATEGLVSQWDVSKDFSAALAIAFGTSALFGLSIYLGTPRRR